MCKIQFTCSGTELDGEVLLQLQFSDIVTSCCQHDT